jgi:hypothetical protein
VTVTAQTERIPTLSCAKASPPETATGTLLA